MPSCIRPQRQPKPLVTTPFTGQMKPLDDDPSPVEPHLTRRSRRGSAPQARALRPAWSSRSSSASCRSRPHVERGCSAGSPAPQRARSAGRRAPRGRRRARRSCAQGPASLWRPRLGQPRLLARDPHLVLEPADLRPSMARSWRPMDSKYSSWSTRSPRLWTWRRIPNASVVLALVELDEPLLEVALRDRVLCFRCSISRVCSSTRSRAAPSAPRCAASSASSLAIERRERADVAAERIDSLARRLDLRGERPLLRLGRRDLLAQTRDLPVERTPSRSAADWPERRGDGQRRGRRREAAAS